MNSPTSTLVLAQSQELLNGSTGAPGAQAPGTGAAPAGASPAGSGMSFLLPMLVVVAFFLIFTSMASRREKKKRQSLLDSVKKYDKVLTIGGIIGTVAEVRDDEVVLRVDDSGNNKIRFQRSAIQAVLTSGTDPAGSAANVEIKNKSPERAAV